MATEPSVTENDTLREVVYEEDGCGCRFRYGDDGSFSVLNVCTYHEQEREEAYQRGLRDGRHNPSLDEALNSGDGVYRP